MDSQRLLDLLHAIELGQTSWPTAVLYGVVNFCQCRQVPTSGHLQCDLQNMGTGQSSAVASLAHTHDGRGSFWFHARM